MNRVAITRGFDIPRGVLEKWHKLWLQAEYPTPNAHPDWFLATLPTMNAAPFIFELEDGDGREGMLIARCERTRVSPRVGYMTVPTPRLNSLVVVYGGILGSVCSDAVLSCLYGVLEGESRFDHIMLNMLAINHPVMGLLRSRRRAVIQPATPHWVKRLDGTFDDVLRQHSDKHRRILRKERRILEESFAGQLLWQTFTREADIERILEDASWIGKQTYHARLGGGLVSPNELWRAQLKLAAKTDRLRAHFVIGNGTPIAFLIGWNESNRLHFWSTGFLPEYADYSPGKHVLLHAIKRACEDGMKWVDFGFGDAKYKQVYGTEFWHESTVHIYGAAPLARLAYRIDSWSMRLDSKLKSAVGLSFGTKIKRSWREWLRVRSK